MMGEKLSGVEADNFLGVCHIKLWAIKEAQRLRELGAVFYNPLLSGVPGCFGCLWNSQDSCTHETGNINGEMSGVLCPYGYYPGGIEQRAIAWREGIRR